MTLKSCAVGMRNAIPMNHRACDCKTIGSHLNTRFAGTRVYSPFTVVVSDNVLCQGMVILSNPVCVLLSGMLHVYKSEVRAAVFET